VFIKLYPRSHHEFGNEVQAAVDTAQPVAGFEHARRHTRTGNAKDFSVISVRNGFLIET